MVFRIPRELWRTCVLNDHYEVSNLGRVRLRVGNNRRPKGYVLRLQPGRKGYLQCGLWRKCKMRMGKVHRLVLLTFVGPCPPGMESLHKDGNHLNNRLSNLRWGTRSENTKDAVKHGTHAGFSVAWARGSITPEICRAKILKGWETRRRNRGFQS